MEVEIIEEEEQLEYGEIHRSILRKLITCGILKMSELRSFVDKIPGVENAKELDLVQIIEQINRQVKSIHNIQIVKNELTTETEVVLKWVGKEDLLMGQLYFTPEELEFFQLVMNKIVISDRKLIPGIEATNFVSKMKNKNYNKVKAEAFLKRLCDTRYLKQVDEGSYIFDTRMIHEFKPYFITNMKSVLDNCNVCDDIVFQCVVCPHCTSYFHKICLTKYVNNINKWPCCKKAFEENLHKLTTIKDLENVNSTQNPDEPSTSRSQKKKRKSSDH